MGKPWTADCMTAPPTPSGRGAAGANAVRNGVALTCSGRMLTVLIVRHLSQSTHCVRCLASPPSQLLREVGLDHPHLRDEETESQEGQPTAQAPGSQGARQGLGEASPVRLTLSLGPLPAGAELPLPPCPAWGGVRRPLGPGTRLGLNGSSVPSLAAVQPGPASPHSPGAGHFGPSAGNSDSSRDT